MQFSFAQEKTITGSVTDAQGNAVAGANVTVQGTTRKVQTGFDGNFNIKAKEGDVLLFSFVGMQEVRRTIGTSSSYSIKMAASADEKLTEIVIQGYGRTSTKLRSNIASQTVTAKTIENRPNPNVLQSLQGQLAGTNIALSSGQPGTNKVDVLIRGSSSLNASSDPLYVIDGIPMNQAFFRNLNPSEIESVSVLKDAGATAIYGNRGANGVIIINTKKGSFNSKLGFSYNTNYGAAEFRGDDYNLVDANEHLRVQATRGVGRGATLTPAQLAAYNINTDWRDVFFRTGTTTSHDVAITGGSAKMTSYTGIGYFEQQGIVPTTNFKRFNLRQNISGKSENERFKYGVNIMAAFSQRRQLEQETRSVGAGNISGNVLQNPLTGYLNSARYLDPSVYVSGQQLFNDFGSPNLDIIPYMLMDLFKGENAPSRFNEYKTIVSANASYKITEALTYTATAGTDYAEDRRNFAIGPQAYLSVVRAAGANQPSHGLEQIRSNREFMFNFVNKLNYNKTFGKHNVDASVFTEYMKAHRQSFLLQQTGLNPLTWRPGAGTGYITWNPALPLSYLPQVAAAETNAGLFSGFATLDYDYDDKYGISGSIRRDGSYRFVNENKWGTFYTLAARWNISEENFLKDSNIVNELKLRASYGTAGNQNIAARGDDSDVSTIFGGARNVRSLNSLQQGYNGAPSFGVQVYGNQDLRWENVAQANIGIDYRLFNRLSGSVDVYDKRTTDLYMAVPISYANGIIGPSLDANNGELGNKGIEVAFKLDILRDTDLKLSMYANGAKNINDIRSLGAVDNGTGIQRIGADYANALGGPSFQYNLVPYIGVNPVNGNLLFRGANGAEIENPTDVDRTLTNKNRLPVFQGGFGLSTSYKGFYLDAAFVYAADFYKFDADYSDLMDIRNVDPFPISRDLLNPWTPTNTGSDVPSWDAANLDSQNISDRFLRDASYLRMRNISIGYSVPNKFLDNTFVKSIRFTLQGENLITVTKWKGFDPESFEETTTGYFPTPKIYTFGVNVNF